MSWSAPTTPVKKEEGTPEGSPGGSEPMDQGMMSPSPIPRSRDDSSPPGPSRASIPMIVAGHLYNFIPPLPSTFMSRIPVPTSIRPGVRPVQHAALTPRGLGLAPTFFKARFNKSMTSARVNWSGEGKRLWNTKAKFDLVVAGAKEGIGQSSQKTELPKPGTSSGPSASSQKSGFFEAPLPTSPQPGCSKDLLTPPPKPSCSKTLVTASPKPGCSKDAWTSSPKPGCSKDMFKSSVKFGGKAASSLKSREPRGPLASSRKPRLSLGKLASSAPNLGWNNCPVMSSPPKSKSSKAQFASSTPKPSGSSTWSWYLTQSPEGNFDEKLTPSPPGTPKNFAGARALTPKKANQDGDNKGNAKRRVVTPITLSLSSDSSQASASGNDIDISMISSISDDNRPVSAAALDEDKENDPTLWKEFDEMMNIIE